MDRKDEVIALQMDVISQMTMSNLRRLSDDLWGTPTPSIPKTDETKEGETAPVAIAKEEQAQAEAQQEPKPTMEELLEELHSYIGLENVKEEVQSLINLVKVQKMRRQNDLPVKDLSLHMVFSGNPGTGKTMIARLMSKVYWVLGILSKGHLVEVDRSGLVAGFVGQTAIKTDEVIKKAMGGVLFIDEAYALTSAQGNDYGQEAVNTLLKAMEDHRDDLVVIVAGYTDLMKDFVASNPGLESRFNRFMHFEDYDVTEMIGIFDLRCKQSAYELDEPARELIKSLLAIRCLEEGFGNARGVRNLFERAVSAQANRLALQENVTREELMTITCEDLQNAESE